MTKYRVVRNFSIRAHDECVIDSRSTDNMADIFANDAMFGKFALNDSFRCMERTDTIIDIYRADGEVVAEGVTMNADRPYSFDAIGLVKLMAGMKPYNLENGIVDVDDAVATLNRLIGASKVICGE